MDCPVHATPVEGELSLCSYNNAKEGSGCGRGPVRGWGHMLTPVG